MAATPTKSFAVLVLINFYVLLFFLSVTLLRGEAVVIHNDIPRYDVEGNIVDCHSGNVVKHPNASVYFLYGEKYGNSTGFNENQWPQLVVYSSPDMISWSYEGYLLVNPPNGTFFTPFVVYNPGTYMFVVWFNYYPDGCCAGNWGVATSSTGTNFTISSLTVTGKYPDVDCNGLFVDDDGTGYVIYSSIQEDHQVSIEKLAPDFLSSTLENYGFFPDHYIEGAILFKRNGVYYVTYGSCCCFCRGGSGVVVFSSANITGPWTRQGPDINCNTSSIDVCGAYGEVVTGNIIVPGLLSLEIHRHSWAQGIGLSLIPLQPNGEIAYLWHGERWLSAPYNNASCTNECESCSEPPSYVKGHGFAYWYPLEFDDSGKILQFSPFLDYFTLDLF